MHICCKPVKECPVFVIFSRHLPSLFIVWQLTVLTVLPKALCFGRSSRYCKRGMYFSYDLMCCECA